MEKKRAIILTIIAVAIMLVCIVSATYAYFIASVEGTGNTTNNQESVTAVEIGSIYYDGVTTYNGTKIYPGMKAIQEFKIGPNSTSGTGTYEIDLEGTVPSAFGSDILVKLYKTTDKSNNNLVRTEGALVQSGNQFYKEDTIIVNGTPELVYEDVLSNNNLIILEQAEFDVTTMQETTYYLVYEYKNNGNQDSQQGLTFSGKVTVRLGFTPPDVKYAVSVYGIEEDTYSLDNGSTIQTAGLTFGPATGASFVNDYVSQSHNGAEHSGTTALGNPYRCIHDDDWETIIYWNDTDPYVYEKCKGDADHLSCTKAVPLYLNSTIKALSYPNMTGDGAGMLLDSIKTYYKEWNHCGSTSSVLASNEKTNGTNRGGWPDSAIRNTLNGVVTDNMLNITNKENGFESTKLTENNSLLSNFPKEIRDAIVPKAVKSDTVSGDRYGNNVTTYDKLWLFSQKEMNAGNRVNEGNSYSKQTIASNNNVSYNERGFADAWWARSIHTVNDMYVYMVYDTGGFTQNFSGHDAAIAPGFALR